jgi:soluble lytic murein transglycosylase
VPLALPSKDVPSLDYASALRRRDWKQAALLMDAATEAERKTPELRYARATVALAMGDVETSLRSVDELEAAWPQFKNEAAKIRLEAAAKSKDVTLLGHFLGPSTEPSDMLALAQAHLESANPQEACELADRALTRLKISKTSSSLKLAARGRLIKAQCFEELGFKDLAAKEYYWLATDGVSVTLSDPSNGGSSTDFNVQLIALNTKLSLSAQDRLNRARVLSEQGNFTATEAELRELKALSLTTFSEAKREALDAWALYYSRSDYLQASQLFKQAAARGGADRKKLLYYEAKALARSHEDVQAIDKYEALAELGGEYAEHAAYQVARLRFIDGQWTAAAKGYQLYLKKYGLNARHHSAATYDLPIARLAAGDFAAAQTELQELRRKSDSPRTRVRLAQLQAVALQGEKKEAEAAELFKKVIRDSPLSYPALLSQARLAQMKVPGPPLIAPPPAGESPHSGLTLSLPEKVWRLSRVGLDDEAESALREMEPELRTKYTDRSGEALCRLYGQLESAKRRYQVAQTAASWSVLDAAPTMQSEWQWDCIYPSPYAQIVREESERYKVPAPFVYGIMRQESAFRPSVVSPALAVGLMQIIPPTAMRIAGEIKTHYEADLMTSPAINISYGTYYLRRLLNMFGERLELAAASYNAGPQAVTRWLRAGETLPVDIFVARIPYEETRNYVYLVMGNTARYAYRDDRLPVPQVDLKLPSGLRATKDAY